MSTLNLGQAELLRLQMEEQQSLLKAAKEVRNRMAMRKAMDRYRELNQQLSKFTPQIGLLVQVKCR